MKDIKELKNKINIWWKNLRYLYKLEILHEIYDLDFSEIERQGVGNLWNTWRSIEQKKAIMERYEKKQKE